MKRTLIVLIISILLLLVGCSSSEGEELVNYHKNYVENVNTIAEKVDVELQKSFLTETPEETYELQTKNVKPLIIEIKEYIESQKPESEPVKELHELRLKQLGAWEEAFNLQYQALEKTIESASEEEVSEILLKSDQKIAEAAELGQKADEKMGKLAEDLNVSLK
jgi:Tfp pilus assembly protein PilP